MKSALTLLFFVLIPWSIYSQSQAQNSNKDKNFPNQLNITNTREGTSFNYIYQNKEILSRKNDYNEEERIIVEFKEQPLFVQMKQNKLSKASALNSIQMIFSRFEQDLNKIESEKSSSLNKSYSQAGITKKFYKVYFGVGTRVPKGFINEIKKLDYVKNVFPDAKVEANNYLEESLNQIRVPQIWQEFNTKGEGIIIGTLDTGIDYLHPALGGGFGPGYKVIGGYDLVNNDPDPMDDSFHGTHVAGIIAADGDSLTGVAPKAKLMAFKVLDSEGHGYASTIVAGIEMALDPNNDNDFSDMVDILNLSLGNPAGDPYDPQSIAVNNAVKLGMVVCVSAGNSGNGDAFLTIGSPGTASDAITVGACDNTNIMADFSSKGPVKEIYTIKPDIIAPGSHIISSIPNNQYKSLSGTSMAAPHISGVCALIKSLHPDWTPAKIKSAIMTTAKNLNREAMVQGAGRVDAYKAAKVSTLIIPSSLSLGFDAVEMSTWTKSDTITITNNSAFSQNYTISETGILSGITINIQPSNFSIPAGGSEKIIFTLNVDNGVVTDKNNGTSLSYSGLINFNGSTDTLKIPWAFVKTQKVTFQSDEPIAGLYMIPDDHNNPELQNYFGYSKESTGPYKVEFVNVPNISYQFFAYFGSGGNEPQRFIYKPLFINGSTKLEMKKSDAPNLIILKGVDKNGNLLFNKDKETGDYKTRFTIVSLKQQILGPIVTLLFNSDSLYLSDIANYDIYSTEYYNDLKYDGNVFLIQHQTVTDLNSSNNKVVLINNSNDLISQKISARFQPDASDPQLRFLVFFAGRTEGGRYSLGLDASDISVPDKYWKTKFVTNLDINSQFGFTMGIVESPDTSYKHSVNLPKISSNDIRVYNGKIISYNDFNPSPETYFPINDLDFGLSPIVPGKGFWFLNESDKIWLSIDYEGALGEKRWSDFLSTTFEIFDADNNLVSSGNVSGSESNCSGNCIRIIVNPDKYKTKFENTGYYVGPKKGKATFINSFDTRQTDNYPPVISSLKLLNSSGVLVENLQPGEKGKLVFSAGDYNETEYPLECFKILDDSTHLYVKASGDEQWNEVFITKTLENYESFPEKGYFPIGSLYNADLDILQNVSSAFIDIKIDIQDIAGNHSEWLLEPAFSIGDPVVSIDDNDDANIIPKQFTLYQNYPNPFNPTTVIRYELPKESLVSIKLFDILGREVKTLVKEMKTAGRYIYNLDASNLASGIYFYRLQAGSFVQTKKMVLMK